MALSDNIQFIELFVDFISFITNIEIEKPVVYEDCTAVISMGTECGVVIRTKIGAGMHGIVQTSAKGKQVTINQVLQSPADRLI